ncbi:3-deoxy-D-manno-octulosonic acid transferase [Geomonas sp. RF6]|uniref:3-deoxy-D-manno-octulosonic acid transferase n=1 Tax=Geomonas sp. RF6 TaxID=2897342 RepID=UPI001E33B6FF|nr:3-deoxy-D-manno-octulosonic acid transferase [Geomonas sp. RF6]UFS68636.1 3-deoxy-D-manno-octulosonic acid transferase [Geomonas sp. RF6]
MISIVYNLLLFISLPLVVAYHCYRSLSRGRRSALLERFGRISPADLATLQGSGCILVHAVSVGETNAAIPLLKGLRRRFPGKKIVLSNVTETGRSVALKSGLADLCIYFPFDYPFAVRSVLGALNPSVVIIMETEIWPNFIGAARSMGIPVVLANGRISDRSLSRYLKFSWFFRPVLQQLSALCMQSSDDASRIVAIGANNQAVRAAGNLKYDRPLHPRDPERVNSLKEKYGIPADCIVFTAASTHEGEEAQVVEAYQGALKTGRKCFMILAPRHPERAAGVAQLLSGAGLPFVLRSALGEGAALPGEGGVLLLDTVGELASLYEASDLVFVGGSLVPTGGHNPLEPASCSVSVLFGPHMENFREIAALFLKYQAARQVPDVAALKEALEELLDDPGTRREMGEAGGRVLIDNAGATERHLDVVESFIRR